MKKFTLFLISMATSLVAMAQAPQSFSYQAIIRDSEGALVSEQIVGLQISLIQGSTTGSVIYSEVHNPTTTTNGLITIQIGGGTSTVGDFSAIEWANGPFFLETEVDPEGGTNYTISGITQLLSVPFALYAAQGGDPQVWTQEGDTISYTQGLVGIGTNTPSADLHVQGKGSGSSSTVLIGNDYTNSMQIRASGNEDFYNSNVILERSRGTNATPESLQAGDRVGGIFAGPYINGAYQRSAGIQMFVGETLTASGYPTNIRFETTAADTTAREERMRITESGEIGIGTTSPQAQLEIVGNNSNDPVLQIGNTNTSASIVVKAAGELDYQNANLTLQRSRGTVAQPTALLSGDRIGGLYGSPYDGADFQNLAAIEMYMGNFVEAGNSPTNIRFATTPYGATAREEQMRITESGTVGIGTITPAAQLHVTTSNTSQPAMLLENEGSTASMTVRGSGNVDYYNANLSLERSRGTISEPLALQAGDRIGGVYGKPYLGNDYQSVVAIQMFVESGASASSFPSSLRFETTASGSTARAERMRITDAGKVGIGTSQPEAQMHINTTATDEQVLLMENESSTAGMTVRGSGNVDHYNANLTLERSRGTISTPLALQAGDRIGGVYGNPYLGNDYQPAAAIQMYVETGASASSFPTSLRFETTASGSIARAERMRITDAGKVGIGTSQPEAQVHINSTAIDEHVLLMENESSTAGMTVRGSGNVDYYNANLTLERSRGTISAPIALQAGDRIGGVYGNPYLGNDYQSAAAIQMYVETGASASSFPTSLRFETTANGSTTRTERMRISSNGNVGLGTSTPASKLQLASGDIYLEDATSGVIMTSPNGQCWKMTVDDSGNPVFAAVTCPN